ncbi:MAG: DNA polymerase IV [Phycisphaerae bacterium]|nr:DNA polymerase IV [Phycisphaerae bacterium]
MDAATRHILHVDMDEFFAAVEKLDNPELRGRPLLVGGDPKGRGVVSTASYEARVFGCHSAMPMATAIRLCPQAIVLPVRGARYGQVSEQIFAIFDRFTPLVEPLSIDEAFLDLTGTERLLGPPERTAARIKQAVRDEVGLTASVGLAPNKFLAKLASDLQKPDGLTIVEPGRVAELLDPLPIRKLWGVGAATAAQLDGIGVKTIGQLREIDRLELTRMFGRSGEHYWRLARGLDDRDVTPDHAAKSIGQETTFPRDLPDPEQVAGVLLGQVEQVARRCRRHGLAARTVTLKIRYGDFKTITRSRTLGEPTDRTNLLWAAAKSLFDEWAKQGFRPVRLIGATASGLQARGTGQGSLFPDPDQARQGELDRAVDRIVDRFGKGVIGRGGRLRAKRPEADE